MQSLLSQPFGHSSAVALQVPTSLQVSRFIGSWHIVLPGRQSTQAPLAGKQ
jgi:hypothetical protein